MAERLQKLLSQWGLASRRQAEQMIREGRVVVNGAIADLGQKANPAVDMIQLDGRVLEPVMPDRWVWLLNKPAGVVSTCHDPQGRPTVIDHLPQDLRQGQGIHPVGRLDADSTGALLLTNDGQLTYQLTHPRHHIPKQYHVWVRGQPSAATLRQWSQGIMLDGRQTQPAQVTRLTHNSQQTLLEITLWEGRNRQIRRTADQLGHPVLSLHRIAIGQLALGSLASGKSRPLTRDEITRLQAEAGTPKTAAIDSSSCFR
ncbi:putative RNA pseudouridine synthase [Halomicronema hongdechloris C2206]|uniref:Pseudouridine synthase n=1 Tax=Halomicronema hongdechloris C2206 TaxID=1641165 RepID=A0A1Z3HMJ3_9CYAN|nr:pseudouridine synthase [Halomicronema hongdechloris]ASC71534.1 putative RNA pseudouridine synthase [Halomicronema hongdechloris C2206]